MKQKQPLLRKHDAYVPSEGISAKLNTALLVLTVIEALLCGFLYIASTVVNAVFFVLVAAAAAGMILTRILWYEQPLFRTIVRILYAVITALIVGFAVFSLIFDVANAKEADDAFVWWSVSLYGSLAIAAFQMVLVFLLPVMAMANSIGLVRDRLIFRIAVLLNVPLTALSLLYASENFGFPVYNEGLLPLGDFFPVSVALTVFAAVIAAVTLVQYLMTSGGSKILANSERDVS